MFSISISPLQERARRELCEKHSIADKACQHAGSLRSPACQLVSLLPPGSCLVALCATASGQKLCRALRRNEPLYLVCWLKARAVGGPKRAEKLHWHVSGVIRKIRAGQGVAAGEEPPSKVRLGAGLGGRLLQAGPQLVQERRPLAVRDGLQLGGDGGVYELAPTPGRGSGRLGGR